MQKDIVKAVENILDPLLSEKDLELVDLEYLSAGRGKILRIYIDKSGGVTLGDCENVSKELSALLDVHNVIPYTYTLEVSSPGLTRPLKRPRDFERSKGKNIKIKTKTDINEKRVFRGRLVDYIDETVSVQTEEGFYTIPLDYISEAKLVLDL
jgi:ribosome maturation factor RimP